MNRSFITAVAIALFSLSSFAQNGSGPKQSAAPLSIIPVASNISLDLAKGALAAHGGDKLKNMKSIVMKGSVDLNVSNQTMPGAFSTAISGEKYYFEINSVVQSLKQIYDGRQTYSSIPGFSLPPVTSLGFPLLPKVGDAGYPITPLDAAKKKKGFRITTPDGFYTDFFVNEKTGQIKGYESSYDMGGRIVTTSVEIDEFQTVEGIVVPKKYAQRFDLGQLTAYASFNIKNVLVNSPIEDSAFSIPR